MTTLNTLKEQLRDAKSHTDPAEGESVKKFMPDGCLDQILTAEAVALVLADPAFGIPEHKLDSTIDIVSKDSLKLLAILVELNLESNIIHFLENDTSDERLPLRLDELKILLQHNALHFERLQWDYLPFRFRAGLYQTNVSSEKVIPYTLQKKVGSGGFSVVYKVAIHPAQQYLASHKDIFFARKKLTTYRSSSNLKRNEEAELLFLLGSVKHRNIIELLAAYTQDGIVNFLFPYFELDLHQFLLQNQRPTLFEEDPVIFRALHGLSSGLAYLHNFRLWSRTGNKSLISAWHGYHHDIKPRNILVGSGTFILSDFGLSKLKIPDEETQTSWKDTTFEYGAPECRDQFTFEAGKVGRALDIWSLACVSCEVATYILLGAEGVTEFRVRRRIQHAYGMASCFHDGSRVSSNVRAFLRELEGRAKMPSLHALLSIIRPMFSEQPEERPKAKEVETSLGQITLGAFSSKLAHKIDMLGQLPEIVSSNIAKARLTIEKNRLLAWEAVIGLNPIPVANQPNETQFAFISISEMTNTVQMVFEKLASSEKGGFPYPSHEALITVLQSMNDELSSLTPKHLKQSIEDRFMVITTENIDKPWTKDEGNFKVADPKADALEVLEQLKGSSGGNGTQSSDLSRTAAIKYLSILFNEDKLQPSSPTIQATDITEDTSPGDANTRPNVFLYKKERRVLIEWQLYGARLDDEGNSSSLELLVYSQFDRVKALATMLGHRPQPERFRVLDCLGPLHDPKNGRSGLVYTFPKNDTLPIRLHKLFRHNGRQLRLPNPTEKLALARAIVNAINSFHVSGWLHKGINSYNVLFFQNPSESPFTLTLSQPYIVGFDHSRPDSHFAFSEGPNPLSSHSLLENEYIHPKYRKGRSRYHRCYDYYSLGLLLLEIGTWHPLSTIYQSTDFRTFSPDKLRLEYIKCCDNQLLLLMGEIYSRITKECLQVDEWACGTEPGRLMDFQSKIVEGLQACNF